MSKQKTEKQKLQQKAGQVNLKSNEIVSKMKEEIVQEAKAIASATIRISSQVKESLKLVLNMSVQEAFDKCVTTLLDRSFSSQCGIYYTHEDKSS